MTLSRIYRFMAVVLILALVMFIWSGLDQSMTVQTYVIKDERVTSPITITVIADLHSCYYGEDQEDLIQAIEASEPDVVVMVGDLIDDRLPMAHAVTLVSEIQGRWPTYYVSGNHEYWSNQIREIKAIIEGYDITILAGESEIVELKGQSFIIGGVDDPEVGEALWTSQLLKTSDTLPEDTFSVLLTHRPERVEDYRATEYDLMLAGHAHGGQWRLPGLLNGLLAPDQGFFPRFAGGLYALKEDQQMIVSRGLARESTRIPRFYNRPELVVVKVE